MSTCKSPFISRLNLWVFTISISCFGLFSFVLPKKEFSELEKRKLAAAPIFSTATIFTGSYMKDIDSYFADNFAAREQLVQLAFWVRDNRGLHSNDIALYMNTEPSETMVTDTTTMKPIGIVSADTTSVESVSPPLEVNLENKGLMVVSNRVLQLFGGSKKSAHRYTDMINAYKKTLSDSVNVCSIVIPSPATFYIPEEHKKLSNNEPNNINEIYASLDNNIKKVDAYSELSKHTKEYLYFRTDHHWTGLGAYYAYRAFCKEQEFTPIALDSMKMKTISGFLGSLYSKTRDKSLKDSSDYVNYWVIPGKYKTWCYLKKNPKKAIATSLLAERAKGESSYSVFLGSDYPLMKVETDNKNGRRAVLIKNSFGNAFAPFLVPHYEQVFVMDYRYYSGGLSQFIKENKITDVIFLSDTFLANADSHQKKLKKLLR